MSTAQRSLHYSVSNRGNITILSFYHGEEAERPSTTLVLKHPELDHYWSMNTQSER